MVDDDSSIRGMLYRVLSPTYDVVLVANGAEALAEVRRQPPALVLLDLRMPVMDGWQFLARLEAEGFHPPVVVMSCESQSLWPSSPLVRGHHRKLDGLTALLAACARVLTKDAAQNGGGPPD